MFSPFTGLLFDPAIVPSVGDASSPPYDVINEDERRTLQASSPYNVVRLLLADADDPSYTEAARLLRDWRADGTLVADPGPRLYLYSMSYEYEGRAREARGVLGSLRHQFAFMGKSAVAVEAAHIYSAELADRMWRRAESRSRIISSMISASASFADSSISI